MLNVNFDLLLKLYILMKSVRLRWGTTENSLEKQSDRDGARRWIIKSAGEPESEIGPKK
jgi:hypothetical protein